MINISSYCINIFHNQLIGKYDFGKSYGNFRIDKTKSDHVLIKYRQIVIHMSLFQLLHCKPCHTSAVFLIYLRFFLLHSNNVAI